MILAGSLFLLASVATQLAAWQWPVTGPSVGFVDGDGDPQMLHRELSAFRFTNRSGEDLRVVSPISGTVIFFDETGSSKDHDGDVLVVRDANEMWVILRMYGMAWADTGFRISERVSAGDLLGRAEVVELEIYDNLSGRYVNPRALLPFTEALPEEGLPPLTFIQADEEVAPDSLAAGTVQIVIAREDAVFSRFPRRVYVLRNGLLEAQRFFVYQEELEALTTQSGRVRLYESELVAGVNEIDFEAHRFDGTIVRRTVRLMVPEPADEPPLDTP